MTAVSDSKIEKFEYEMQEPAPYDIVQMADAYHRPDLCNYSLNLGVEKTAGEQGQNMEILREEKEKQK